MTSNPVIYYTFIIRSQIEYSTLAQAVVMRCILETPANGQHKGFTDVESLLSALRAELMDINTRAYHQQRKNENDIRKMSSEIVA